VTGENGLSRGWAVVPDGPSFDLRRATPTDLARRSAAVLSVLPGAAVPLLKGGDPRRLSRRDAGRALRLVAQRLGGSWVKVGQLLASAPGLVGDEISEELRPLLDTSPAVSPPRVEAAISRAWDRPVRDLLAELDPVPVGTGSLAVVHRGVTRDGQVVAVKVLRPGIERDSAADLVLIETVLDRLAAWRGMDRSAFRALVAGLRMQLSEELDLRREAAHMGRFQELFSQAGLSRLVIPRVYEEMSGRRVLTMEFLEGVAIDDLSAIERMGGDPAPLVAEALQAWWATVGVAGMFHGDVHAGNLIYTNDGRLGIIDWGIVGRLSEKNRSFMLAMLSGAAGDEGAWGQAADLLMEGIPERVRRRDDFDAGRARVMITQGLSYALTRPYGEVSLGALLSGEAFKDMPGEDADGRAGDPGSNPGPGVQTDGTSSRGVRGRSRGRRLARRRASPRSSERVDRTEGAKGADQDGSASPEGPDRDILLLGKQLLYFERYGKQYLSDRSVLSDAAFVLDLVKSHPANSE